MRSIQRALLYRLLIGVTLLAAPAVAALYVHQRSELREEFDEEVLHEALEIGGLVRSNPDGRLGFEFVEHAMPEFAHDAPEPQYFEVRHDDGRLFTRSPSLGERALLPGVVPPVEGKPFDVYLPDGRPGRAVLLHVAPASDEAGGPTKPAPGTAPMAILFACGREDVDEPLADLLTSFALLVVVLTLGTSAVVIVAVRTGLRPLRQLADAAGSVDATSLDFRFPADRLPAELRPIAGRLNDLLARLDTAFRRERRFSADVAHELRTPIAELRTLSEVALRWPAPGDGDGGGNDANPADATPRFREVLDIACQMERIVNALLTLLRARPDGQLPAADESAPVDLRELMDATWRPHAHAAEARGISARFDVPAALTVHVDRTLLASIVGNLLSNAVRYTPERGAINCTAEVVGGAAGGGDGLVRLAFGNTNATLTEADLPHLWEPFWRKDSARVNATQSGLGLALVDGISRSLGLHVSAELPRPDWFVVRISIPLSARLPSTAPPATAPLQTS